MTKGIEKPGTTAKANSDSQIKSQLNEILIDAKSALSHTALDKIFINAAINRITAINIITETDRYLVLSTFQEVLDLFIEYCPDDEDIESVKDSRNQVLKRIQDSYSENSLYSMLLNIIMKLLNKLNEGTDLEQSVGEAYIEIGLLSFESSDENAALIMQAFARIIAIKSVIEWSRSVTKTMDDIDPLEMELVLLAQKISNNGFDKEEFINTFQNIVEMNQKHSSDFKLFSEVLIKLFGLGIITNPGAFPALEPIEAKVFELFGPYLKQIANQLTDKPSTENSPSDIDRIIADTIELIDKDGFSLYALQQAMTDLKNLPADTEDEFNKILEGLMKLFDLGIKFGDEETSLSLGASKEVYQKFLKMTLLDRFKLSPDEAIKIIKQTIVELKRNLEKGEMPSAAISRAMTTIQLLIPLISFKEYEENEKEYLQHFFQSIFTDMFNIIGNYVPEDTKLVWKEAMKAFGGITEVVDLIDAPEAEQSVLIKKMEQRMGQFMNTTQHFASITESAKAIPHVKQFIELLPGLAMRLMNTDISGDTHDQKEFERLKKDLDDTIRLMSNAYTEQQFIEHQKIGLRRMAIELGNFEKRGHLMIVKPIFAVEKSWPDANRIFYSGSGDNSKLIVDASNTLGMTMSTRRSVANALNSRWSQLCESGIAIFDYSNYNPSVADPFNADLKEIDEETTLNAASPVSIVAYENGLAYALGKPVVIIVTANQPIPFDIDIEPVKLQNDGNDLVRLIEAIQIALYGANRASQNTCLNETWEYFCSLYKNYNDNKIQELVGSLKDTSDAIKFRLTIESVLDRITGDNQMVVTPAFTGGYPDQNLKSIFHITAFRQWSKTLERELKAICNKKGWTYKIGYEQLSPEILPSIWEDITTSHFVIADITNLNPNAMLELALTHVVGCPTLILTQNKDVQKYFPPLQKIRTHVYDPRKKEELTQLIEAFFESNS